MELKIPPLLLTCLFAVVMMALALFFPGLAFEFAGQSLMGMVTFVLGVMVCAAGVLSFRLAGTTVNPVTPEKASSLVVVGIYHVSRNPMYLGFLLALAGTALYLGNWLCLLAPVVFVLYMNRYQIVLEEKALEALFGEEYRTYKRQVRRWL